MGERVRSRVGVGVVVVRVDVVRLARAYGGDD